MIPGMIREIKAWGFATHIFQSPHAAVSYLELKAGTRCSCHKHDVRVNHFHLLSGKVIIERWVDGIHSPTITKTLRPGESYVVPTGVWHRFRVVEDGQMIEVYWPDAGGEVKMDDIVRVDVGGDDNLEFLQRIARQERTL